VDRCTVVVGEETNMEAIYEDQITIFLDFLGFSEASVQLDESAQAKMLTLLTAISSMRSQFSDNSDPNTGDARAIRLRPTITTFSDHIVASYPMSRILTDDPQSKFELVLFDATLFTARIAAAALQFGFLIRGGLSYGLLYHTSGIVFGQAMVEAYNLESKSAIYPRVVISPSLLKRLEGRPGVQAFVHHGYDGVGSLDYFFFLISALSPSGSEHSSSTKAYFDRVVPVMKENVERLRATGHLNATSKWVWFAKMFAEALRRTNPAILQAHGISLSEMSWAE
jgi:hypothetical protein